jgi:hypothetical protein
MTILAIYLGSEYFEQTVEITDAWNSSGRVCVAIKTLDPKVKPWTMYTMGGPVDEYETIVPREFLTNIQIMDDECTCTPDRDVVCHACKAYLQAQNQEVLSY